MLTIEEYTRRVRGMLGIAHRDCHLYQGVEGARRIAREYGAGLADYPEEQARDYIRKSYDVCFHGYDLRPPIDAKDWNREVMAGYTRAKNRKNTGGIIAHE
jgi:hypothetical protein